MVENSTGLFKQILFLVCVYDNNRTAKILHFAFMSTGIKLFLTALCIFSKF